MKWISGIVFFVTVASYSQETKFVLKHSDNFEEEYYVLVADKKIKHGTYLKYRNGFSGISILETGNYLNGNRNGQWEFYFSPYSTFNKRRQTNSLKERGSFVNGKKNGLWVSFYADTIPENIIAKSHGAKKRPDSLSIGVQQNNLRPRLAGHFLNDKRVGDWVTFDFDGNVVQRYNFAKHRLIFDTSIKDSLNYPPRYLGGMTSMQILLVQEVNMWGFPSSKDSTTVIAQFSIDSSGRIADIKVYKSNGSGPMEKETIRLVALLDGSWMPASQNGQPVASDYKIAFDIIRSTEPNRTGYFRVGFRPITEE